MTFPPKVCSEDEVDMKQATIWRNFRVFVAAKFKSEEEPMGWLAMLAMLADVRVRRWSCLFFFWPFLQWGLNGGHSPARIMVQLVFGACFGVQNMEVKCVSEIIGKDFLIFFLVLLSSPNSQLEKVNTSSDNSLGTLLYSTLGRNLLKIRKEVLFSSEAQPMKFSPR